MSQFRAGLRNGISIAILAILYSVYWMSVAGTLLAEVQLAINYVVIPFTVGLAVYLACVGDIGIKLGILLIFPPLFMSTSIWDNSYPEVGIIAAILQLTGMVIALLISSVVAKIPKKNEKR